jgi:hypothetical protein
MHLKLLTSFEKQVGHDFPMSSLVVPQQDSMQCEQFRLYGEDGEVEQWQK